MAINKVILNGVTKVDLTTDTATADKVLTGYTFHNASGVKETGTMKEGADLSQLNVKYAYSGYDCDNAGSSPDTIFVYDSSNNQLDFWNGDFKFLTISDNDVTVSAEDRPYVYGESKVYAISTKQIGSVDVVFPEACGS